MWDLWRKRLSLKLEFTWAKNGSTQFLSFGSISLVFFSFLNVDVFFVGRVIQLVFLGYNIFVRNGEGKKIGLSMSKAFTELVHTRID